VRNVTTTCKRMQVARIHIKLLQNSFKIFDITERLIKKDKKNVIILFHNSAFKLVP